MSLRGGKTPGKAYDVNCYGLQPVVRQYCSLMNTIADALRVSSDDALRIVIHIGADAVARYIAQSQGTDSTLRFFLESAERDRPYVKKRAEEIAVTYSLSISGVKTIDMMRRMIERALAKAISERLDKQALPSDKEIADLAQRAAQIVEDELRKKGLL